MLLPTMPTMAVLPLAVSALESAKPPAQPFKVAFIGDTGNDPKDTPELDSNFEKVLALVRSEGAHLLAIAGDFAYEEEADVARVYFGTIDRILGEQFPVLGAAGDHHDWSHYQPFFQARLEVMGLDRARIAGPNYGLHSRVMTAAGGSACGTGRCTTCSPATKGMRWIGRPTVPAKRPGHPS